MPSYPLLHILLDSRFLFLRKLRLDWLLVWEGFLLLIDTAELVDRWRLHKGLRGRQMSYRCHMTVFDRWYDWLLNQCFQLTIRTLLEIPHLSSILAEVLWYRFWFCMTTWLYQLILICMAFRLELPKTLLLSSYRWLLLLYWSLPLDTPFVAKLNWSWFRRPPTFLKELLFLLNFIDFINLLWRLSFYMANIDRSLDGLLHKGRIVAPTSWSVLFFSIIAVEDLLRFLLC